MRVLAVLLITGCSAATPPIEAPRATPIAPFAEPAFADRKLPVSAKQGTKEQYGARDLFEPVIHGRDLIAQEAGWRVAGPQIVDIAEIDYLGRCVRDFVMTQPETARRPLVSAFSHYMVSCDAETGKPMLDRPFGFDVRDRRSSSDAAFHGELSPRGAGLILRLTSCATETSFERISIHGSGTQWTSPRLEVKRRTDGCDVAEIPYTRQLANLILRVTERDAAILFEGTQNSLGIDESLRDELRGVIDAVDAITEP